MSGGRGSAKPTRVIAGAEESPETGPKSLKMLDYAPPPDLGLPRSGFGSPSTGDMRVRFGVSGRTAQPVAEERRGLTADVREEAADHVREEASLVWSRYGAMVVAATVGVGLLGQIAIGQSDDSHRLGAIISTLAASTTLVWWMLTSYGWSLVHAGPPVLSA